MQSSHSGPVRALQALLLCGLFGAAIWPAVPCHASPPMVDKQSFPFTFAVLGDRTGSAEDRVFEQVADDVAFLRPDLVMTVGDLIQGYTSDSASVEEQWDYALAMMDSIGIEYHLTPGNHDMWDDRSRAIYRRRVGNPNEFFWFHNCLFIILDVSQYYTAAALPDSQIEWLREALSYSTSNLHTFVFYHKPFWCEDFSSKRPNLLHEIFMEYGVDAVFTGHYHRQFYTERDGIRYYGVSSSGGGLPGWAGGEGCEFSYLWVRVDADSFYVRTLEPGLGRSADNITMADMMEIDEVLAGVVTMDEIVVESPEYELPDRVLVRIENIFDTTLMDTARWEAPTGWSVDPGEDYVEVPPGDVATLTAFISNDGPVFPVPSLNVRVPYRDGGSLEVDRPAAIKRRIPAGRCGEGPVIDGLLDDEAWRPQPAEAMGFGRAVGDAPGDSTRLRFCHDVENLYIAVECYDTRPDEVRATAQIRDGSPDSDDTCMLIFQPRPEAREFFVVRLNPLGTLFDQSVEICPFGSFVMHPEWDVPATVAARITDIGWTAEIAIPLGALVGPGGVNGGAGVPGPRWGFNFSRWHSRLEALTYFQPPVRYDGAYMGLLELE